MTGTLNVLHYVNQFFAGRGGEEMANMELDAVDGPVGPGARLNTILGDDAEITTTLIAGDNWVAENEDAAAERLREAILEYGPDVVSRGTRVQRRPLRHRVRVGVPSRARSQHTGRDLHVR